ncbi:hypothetical protein [Paraclostridium bifermentans]|uniref:hypothetical protein n=1 Tax=Paraclostridium bifermentans TaxID=1490 RepID=UPI001FF6C65A|nr:hypothetical protein [Paraclostridium bifermentans]UOW66867.1 hypothetical protein MTR78_09920 [Paraclostridium bifermentans]
MNKSEYEKLCLEANKKKLRLTKKLQREIKDIYKQMYLNTSKKLSKVSKDSLSERYVRSVLKSLQADISTFSNSIDKRLSKDLIEIANLANETQLNMLLDINKSFNLDLADTFTDMFAKVPQAAVNEIMSGKLYKDRLGLSKRIWAYTKKFEKDIDYVLAQGIAEKKPIHEIAKDLEVYLNPNSIKSLKWVNTYPRASIQVDYRTQRLARTAINHTFQQAQKRSCQRNPFVSGIKWLTSNSHSTCELCMSREGVVYDVSNLPLDHP